MDLHRDWQRRERQYDLIISIIAVLVIVLCFVFYEKERGACEALGGHYDIKLSGACCVR